MSGRVLIVDDEKNIRSTIAMIHRNAGWDSETAASGREAMEQLANGRFDLVYLDLMMPEQDGLSVLKEIRQHWPQQIVVILTGNASIDKAVDATKLGAFDFLEKDCGKDKILVTSKNALRYRSLTDENQKLRQKLTGPREILGRSDAIRQIMLQIAKVAPTNARVLVLGESGTGKELIAHAVHARSLRSEGPFIKVNCAAIPEELIEAELFGSVKGAFTGAENREGKFEAANGGTLFLDEIGDMSLKVQTKVLRALQEGEIQRVGSNKVLQVDVRVVAATNKELAREVSEGRFREDLYFRLNVVPVVSPPLRDRREDIPLLAETFKNEYCKEHGIPEKELAEPLMAALKKYRWPGNIRELRNQVERLVIMSSSTLIEAADLSPELVGNAPTIGRANSGDTAGENWNDMTLQEAKRNFERMLIQRALEKHAWNVSRAADDLGLERTNLHKKIKQYDLRREGIDTV